MSKRFSDVIYKIKNGNGGIHIKPSLIFDSSKFAFSTLNINRNLAMFAR